MGPGGPPGEPVDEQAGEGPEVRPPGAEGLLTLKEMVRGTGNTPRAIRFYEEEGLLQPARRSPAGHRMYEPRELEKLALISDLRKAGFAIHEIKRIFTMRADRDSAKEAAAEVQLFLTERVAELRRLIDSVVRLRDEFSQSLDILTACADCREPPGEEVCEACTRIEHGALPRTFRWIWSVH